MRQYIRDIWRRFVQPPEPLTDEEWREVRDTVFQDFKDRQHDLVTPLIAAMQQHKGEP